MANVAAVGLDVAKSGCAPNAFVVVTRDKRAFIRGLADKQPDAFGMLTMRQVRQLPGEMLMAARVSMSTRQEWICCMPRLSFSARSRPERWI